MARASASVLAAKCCATPLFDAGHGRWRRRPAAAAHRPRRVLPRRQRWLEQRGVGCYAGQRIGALERTAPGWRVAGREFDAVLLACRRARRRDWCVPPSIRMVERSSWRRCRAGGHHELGGSRRRTAARGRSRPSMPGHPGSHQDSRPLLPGAAAMVTLAQRPRAPAQFAFDRGRLGGPAGLLAFVVSACGGERPPSKNRCCSRPRGRLGLAELRAIRTVVEKRATFARTPGLQRPASAITPGPGPQATTSESPYPATLEARCAAAAGPLPGLWWRGNAQLTSESPVVLRARRGRTVLRTGAASAAAGSAAGSGVGSAAGAAAAAATSVLSDPDADLMPTCVRRACAARLSPPARPERTFSAKASVKPSDADGSTASARCGSTGSTAGADTAGATGRLK